MKTRRFDFNWKPLQLQITFSVEGSVPDSQNYSTDTQEYTPDYTLTPLVIQPNVSIIDKDAVLPSGSINHKLVNIRWYEIISGTKTLIETTNTNYEITTSGGLAGRIEVKKNAEPKVPICLQFYAEYVDTRNGQVLVIQGSRLIKCGSASDQIRVELDAAEESVYNPLRDSASQDINATVWLGDAVCDSSKYALVWEVMGEDNTWHAVGSDETLDYHVTVDGSKATVNRALMGSELHIRCRCKYSAEGTPADVELTDSTPMAMAVIRRRIPSFEYDIAGVPYNIPAGTLDIAPEAVIRDTKGILDNAEDELLPLWYFAKNNGTASLTYSQVGHGSQPVIPTTLMDNTYGGVLALDVKDRGPKCALLDGNGKVVCDGNGKILIIQ